MPPPPVRPPLTRSQLGALGEDIAVRYLTDHGLVVLDRNWRHARGELDVVAREADALVFCDGRREMVLPAGGRLEVTRCGTPLKWVRLDSAPFTDRLVRKFRLPVTGWRGP